MMDLILIIMGLIVTGIIGLLFLWQTHKQGATFSNYFMMFFAGILFGTFVNMLGKLL